MSLTNCSYIQIKRLMIKDSWFKWQENQRRIIQLRKELSSTELWNDVILSPYGVESTDWLPNEMKTSHDKFKWVHKKYTSTRTEMEKANPSQLREANS